MKNINQIINYLQVFYAPVKRFPHWGLGGLAFFLFSCEDVIEIDTKVGETQLVVDAWLTNEPKEQTVKLLLSNSYFDNSKAKPALGATVYVAEVLNAAGSSREDLGEVYEFKDLKGDGNYTWQPKTKTDTLCKIGKQYGLLVQYQGENYVSLSKTNRVPKIDSLTYYADKLPVAPDDGKPQSGFVAEFYGRDPKGEGDCYWIRTYRNTKLSKNPANLSIAYDAGFSPGSKSDGLMFIRPIRGSINTFTEGFWQENDNVGVELLSIPQEAYYFLLQVRQESANGGIFATAPANIPTNIFNEKENGKKALGFFCTSARSSFNTVIEAKKARPKPEN